MTGEKIVAQDAQNAPPDSVPRWAWKLLYRLGTMEKGKLYRLTVVMAGDEPSWAIEAVARIENQSTY